MNPMVLKVSQVNTYAKRILAQDTILNRLHMTGEISNFKRHSSGHLYFVLKDELAAINCVMFAQDARTLRFLPREGQRVIAEGAVSLYEKTGQFQFYARRMVPDGTGALYIAFEALKQKLAAEGLFDPARKKPIPAFPRSVALVTSPTGAAVQDMIHIARRRHPGIQLILVPVLVQGDQAAPSIVQGLRRAAMTGADTIIVGRGGGSLEDLWPFNEEPVARAIAECPVPVISAVGHETDVTIADFAADLRAPTPSAAAELAVPVADELLSGLRDLRVRQRLALRRRIETERLMLGQIHNRPCYRRPGDWFRSTRQALDEAGEAMRLAISDRLKTASDALDALHLHLEYRNPEYPLSRGYSMLMDPEGHFISSITEIHPGSPYQVRLQDGLAHMRAEGTEGVSHGA